VHARSDDAFLGDVFLGESSLQGWSPQQQQWLQPQQQRLLQPPGGWRCSGGPTAGAGAGAWRVPVAYAVLDAAETRLGVAQAMGLAKMEVAHARLGVVEAEGRGGAWGGDPRDSAVRAGLYDA